jgi:protein TonB
MNAPVTNASFAHAPQMLTRPEHLQASSRPARDRIVSGLITLTAHLAAAVALVLGAQMAKPVIAAHPIMADIIPVKQKPQEIKIALPKFTAAPRITVPPPAFEIARPAPPVMTAAPPLAAPVAVAAPPISAPPHGNESRATYLGLLLARLNRFKHYPPEAKAAHIEGVVMLHFVLNHDGRLITAEIAKSSGRPALDREALALMARAQPLPAMPVEMGDKLDAVVPIEFSLHS